MQVLPKDGSGNLQRTPLTRSAVKLGIVCPMANEGDDAVAFCRAVLEQCSGFERVTFFAVFDRANKDTSLDQMRELEKTEPRLRVVWAPEDRCVVDAYLRGYKEALDSGSDWILEIDAGFSHQPGDIPQFFDAMERGMDCVFGSRFIGRFENSSLKRRFISWGGTLLANLLLGTRQTDMTSGFELFLARDAPDGAWPRDSIEGTLLSDRDQDLLPGTQVRGGAHHLSSRKPPSRLIRIERSIPPTLAPLPTSSQGATVKDSSFIGPASLVVTSISAPNAEMRELASQCKARGFQFYVIGDVPSPADFAIDGCEFYSLERQRADGLQDCGTAAHAALFTEEHRISAGDADAAFPAA